MLYRSRVHHKYTPYKFKHLYSFIHSNLVQTKTQSLHSIHSFHSLRSGLIMQSSQSTSTGDLDQLPSTMQKAHIHESATKSISLEHLKFDNLAIRALPIDPITENYTRRVPNACFSLVEPTPVENPKLVAYSSEALELLDIDSQDIQDEYKMTVYFSGNKLLPGARPAAHCYCGHQFGSFSGQLGDGATMYLGEIINQKGERWEIQFKGAGKTPYSRSADGRKVLRSSIREFLCSELMHHLGIPTTRAGTCVTSDTRVLRDIFYSGNPIHERATIITRIAPTFLRFGSFEIFKTTDPHTGRDGPSANRKDLFLQLLHYTISTFYPHLLPSSSSSSAIDLNKMTEQELHPVYHAFYQEIVERTARLVALWQSVGFCHGVLNTDNMSIIGVTIDYGPYGFMESFDTDFICNASDDGGRYSYGNQMEMCRWNCMKLGEAMRFVLPPTEAKEILSRFDDVFEETYEKKMWQKLGLIKHGGRSGDTKLLGSLLELMQRTGADMTTTFRVLARVNIPSTEVAHACSLVFPVSTAASCKIKPNASSIEVNAASSVNASVSSNPNHTTSIDQIVDYIVGMCPSIEALKQRYHSMIPPDSLQMLLSMAQRDPLVLYQFGLSMEVLKKEMEKMKKGKELSKIDAAEKLASDRQAWMEFLHQYQDRLQEEIQGLSADQAQQFAEERVRVMNMNNPKVVLRNWIAQEAIDAAEQLDFSMVQSLLDIFKHVYDEVHPFNADHRYSMPATSNAELKVS